VGHNGEAAPLVCVPAIEVSEFIDLLYAVAKMEFGSHVHRYFIGV
jgi:hypothetical protein